MRSVKTPWLRLAGYAGQCIVGVSGFVVGLAIAESIAGVWGLVLAAAAFPLTVALSPLYALVTWNSWVPVFVVFGGGSIATALVGFGSGGEES